MNFKLLSNSVLSVMLTIFFLNQNINCDNVMENEMLTLFTWAMIVTFRVEVPNGNTLLLARERWRFWSNAIILSTISFCFLQWIPMRTSFSMTWVVSLLSRLGISWLVLFLNLLFSYCSHSLARWVSWSCFIQVIALRSI